MRHISLTFLLVVLSLPVKAMEENDKIAYLPAELFCSLIVDNFTEWTEIESLRAVSRTWQLAIEDEHFWREFFVMLHSHDNKFNKHQSYRENCRNLLVCLVSAECTKKQCSLVKSSAPRICQEICLSELSSELSDDDFAMHLRQAASHGAKVFCSSFRNCFCNFGPNSLAALFEAKNKDILIILQIRGSRSWREFSNSYEVINEKIRTGKENFPNILLIGAACYARCCENAVDACVEPLSDLPQSASLIVTDVASRIRQMRPQLSAVETRFLMLRALKLQLLNYKDNIKSQELFELLLKNTDHFTGI